MSIFGLNNSTISLETFNSVDWAQDPSYNTAVSYPAYVEYKATEMTNQTNVSVTSYAFIMINQEISYKDRITLSDGMVRNPIKVNKLTYPGGLFSQSEVYL